MKKLFKRSIILFALLITIIFYQRISLKNIFKINYIFKSRVQNEMFFSVNDFRYSIIFSV